jgi:hypothetical protein
MGCAAPHPESVVAQDVIVVAAQVLDFGTVPLGDASSPGVVTVDPDVGNQTDTVIDVSASCPDFTLDTPGLPADVHRTCMIVSCDGGDVMCQPGQGDFCQTIESQSYMFSVTFRPTVAGPSSCVVTVHTADDTDDRSITLTGTGVPPRFAPEVQPLAVKFGDVRTATDSAPVTITVRNAGSDALGLMSVVVTQGFEILGQPSEAALDPNGTRDYSVVCHPPGAGPLTGQLTVTMNDPDQTTIDVSLTCNGIDSILDIDPSPAAISTRVGEPGMASIKLSNTGGASMTLEDVTVTGDGITLVSQPALRSIAPGDHAQVTVGFDTTAKGDIHGTLTVAYDQNKVRSTEIRAQVLATSLTLTPSDGDVSFGPVCAGESKTQEFTLKANDQGGFALQSFSKPEAPFTVTAPALPIAVQGLSATVVTFDVTAAPTAAGVADADVVVGTDIPGAAPDHVLHLHVEGLPAGITATPATIELGSHTIHATTIAKQVDLSNCSDAPIKFSNARIEGADPSDFAIVMVPPTSTIMPVEHASWLIVLQAQSVGLKQATFAVDYDGGTASVALQGEGTDPSAPPIAGPPGRGSYYACSTGRPSALWPIAVALLALRRRRHGRRQA